MAIGFVQANGDNAKSLAYAGAVSAGNFLVVGVSTAGAITDFDDDVNGDWGAEDAVESHGGILLYGYVFSFPSTGAGTPTVSFTGGFDNFEHMAVAEFSGVDGEPDASDGQRDGEGGTVANSAEVESPELVIPDADERLLIAVVANNGGRTFTPDAPWTEMYDGADNSRGLSYCYRIVSAAASYRISGDLSDASNWAAVIVSYPAAAGGGGSILPLVACDMDNIRDMGGMRG